MANEKPAKLKLTKLEFLSSCDFPAQGEGGAALLLKSNDFTLKAKVSKLSDELGLVFGYAFASSMDGGTTPHVDYQNDAIDSDFLKVVTEFIEAGGKTDVNHDFEKDGKIVYAWPLLPEINKAMGIESDVIGLAVAVKPSAETYKRFKDGELTGFSIAGEGVRAPLDKARKSKVRKTVSLFTDEIDGHQHQIDIGDDGYTWCSWGTSAGADSSHAHAIARNENGAIVILADSGHTHSLADGQPAVIVVPEGAVVVTEVAMRRLPIASAPTTNAKPSEKRASGSPRSAVPLTVNAHTEKSTMTTEANDAKTIDLEKQVVSLTKRAERGESIAKMSLTEKAYFDTLSNESKDSFIAKSQADRAAAMSADAVEFSLDGIEYRKSTQGYALAKRLRDEVEKNERAEIEKHVGQTIPHLAGEIDAKIALLKAVRRSGESAEMQTKMLGILKGGDAFARGRTVAPGSDAAGVDPTLKSATEQLDTMTIEYAKTNKVDRPTARVEIMKTDEGKRLYAESVGRA